MIMKMLRKQSRKSVSVHDNTISVISEGNDKQCFHFQLADVLRIDAIRQDLITEDTIGLRFWLSELNYEIFEETEGFGELWREIIGRYKPDPARLANFQKQVMSNIEIELWTKPKQERPISY